MLIQKGGAVYILRNKRLTVLYIGVTSDLQTRIRDHKNKLYNNSFTAKYNCDRLVYYELHSGITEAIAREKALKGGNRASKIALVKLMNPLWDDLWESDVKNW